MSDIIGPFNNLYSKDIFPQFSNIINLARDLNARIGIPEVVVVGKKGSNKTSYLESFLGTPILPIDKSTPTKRPMYFQFIQNNSCKTPKITIRRDTKFTEYANDLEIPIKELPEHLETRNLPSNEPIYINYEYQYVWNMIIIDTPGLLSEETDGVTPEQREQLITELCKSPKRLILSVEKAKEEGGSENLDFLKSVDPRLDRTIFIFDDVLDLLKSLTSGSTSSHVNRFMASSPRPNTSFWTTVVSGPSRSKYLGDDELFKEKIEQLIESENKLFEQLKYDMKFRTQIGCHAARKFIIGLIWRKYQENVPQILKKLQGLKQKTTTQLNSIQAKLSNLETYKLRALASQYVMQFLQMIDQLLNGTLAGNPGQNGQTLEEEHSQEEAGPWIDSNYQVIEINPKELGIPHFDSKLYGGQQFGRLMSEYKAVSLNIDFGTVTNNEVATSAGPNNLSNVSNLSWASSDIAQKKIQRSFLPLIDQLYNRATYIVKRLADIVETILKNKKKQEIKSKSQQSTNQPQMGGWLTNIGNSGGLMPSQDSVSAEDYPLFLRTVKSYFYKFVEKTSSECKEKCLDEFYCTRIIYWNEKYSGQKKVPDLSTLDEEGVRELVQDFAEGIFDTTRERITENVLLKCYNFFLVPMQTDLWGEIQGKVTILSDEQIAELFEVDSTRKLLQEEKSQLDNILLQFGEQEKNFLESSKKFANANRN